MKHTPARILPLSLCALMLAGAVQADDRPVVRRSPAEPPKEPVFPAIGSVIRLDPALDKLIAPGARIEKLAEGFDWAEGPVWVWRRHSILFSDVPQNKVWEWDFRHDKTVYLEPSGNTGPKPGQGSNGLTLDSQGRLVLAQHGDRRIARLEKDGSFTTIAQYYKWNRFNSPNDLVYHSNGDLYFTDPPYGLQGGNNSPDKEIPYNGVYRVDTKGEVTLLDGELTFPNGIAFSPDEKTLYVAISDSARPQIVAYDVKQDGTLNLKTRRVFFDAKPLKDAGGKGSPDGLKVDVHGNVWSTGPGGVLVITPDGRHLGTISTGEAIANCGWGHGGSVLYLTSDMYLCRIETLTMGVGPGF
ncbi:MAG TPA: gluconolactonase [Verrucomicrobiales bacterium]|nr:gluconolactonase [Verrucomicrobiales bacterium]